MKPFKKRWDTNLTSQVNRQVWSVDLSIVWETSYKENKGLSHCLCGKGKHAHHWNIGQWSNIWISSSFLVCLKWSNFFISVPSKALHNFLELQRQKSNQEESKSMSKSWSVFFSRKNKKWPLIFILHIFLISCLFWTI